MHNNPLAQSAQPQEETPSCRLRTPLFIIAGQKEDEKIAYAPLRRLAFTVNAAGEAVLARLEKGLMPEQVDESTETFMRTLGRMELFHKLPDAPPAMSGYDTVSYHPTTVTLFLTGNCNLGCSYCYARGGETNGVMSWDLARAALDFVIQNALETNETRVKVVFHGDGEPTLAWPVLQRCIDYTEDRCAEEALTWSFEAGLNGIIAEKRLRWLAPKLHDLTISLDGPPDIQDAQRPLTSVAAKRRADRLEHSDTSAAQPDRDHISSSQIVLRTLRILDELHVRYGLRCTITRRAVERIPEIVEYFCQVSQSAQIQLEPVFAIGRALDHGDLAVDPGTFVRGFLAGRLVAKRHGRRLLYSGARADQITNRFCEAISGAFNLTSDGRVTSCYEVFSRDDPRNRYFAIGGYDRGSGTFRVNLEKIRRASKWTALEKTSCRTCFAKYHCAGDCSAKLATLGDPEGTVDPNRCYVIRELTRAQIFSLYGFGEVAEPSREWQLQPPAHPDKKLTSLVPSGQDVKWSGRENAGSS